MWGIRETHGQQVYSRYHGVRGKEDFFVPYIWESNRSCLGMGGNEWTADISCCITFPSAIVRETGRIGTHLWDRVTTDQKHRDSKVFLTLFSKAEF